MNATELIAEVKAIIAERVRSRDRITADLGKYDRIVGLLRREDSAAADATPEAPETGGPEVRLTRFTLRGFLRFAGEVDVNLELLPEGLIALTGPNGAGKTTLLEAPIGALYRTFASRGEILNYATDRHSILTAEWATTKGPARCRVHVDAVSRGTDALLTLDGRDQNDGKAKTYDAAVARTFPSREVLLASAFASQNKSGAFLTLDKRARKDLFVELLGLSRYEGMAATAKLAAALVHERRLVVMAEAHAASLRSLPELGELLQQEADTVQIAIGKAETDRVALDTAIALRTRELTLLDDGAQAYDVGQARLGVIATELAARRAEADQVQRERDQANADFDRESKVGHDLFVSDNARLGQAITNNEKLLENKDAITKAIATTAEQREAVKTLDAQVEAARQIVIAHGNRGREVGRRLSTLGATQHKLDAAKQAAGLVSTVPCGGAGEYAACRFLTSAAEATALIPALEEEMAEHERLTLEQAEIDTLHDEAAAAYETGRQAVLKAEAMIERLADLVALHPKLEAATARIKELNGEVTALSARRLAADTAIQTRRTARFEALHERQQAIDRALDALVKERDDITDSLLGLQEARYKAEACRNDLKTASRQRDENIAARARLVTMVEDLGRRREAYAAAAAEHTALTEQLERLDTELVEWQTLASAFSRDGLPTLEIDHAGPTISGLTNELLEVCYGSRFTVDLVTQQAKADNKGTKEAFTIAVLDNQATGSPARDIADLSGGEQVIVAEALANAIGIFVNTRSEMPIRTCWRDETTGALDPEHAGQYLQMLRKVQTLGGYHQILFITHNPAIAAQADAQIRIADGAVTVDEPPYAEVA